MACATLAQDISDKIDTVYARMYVQYMRSTIFEDFSSK